MAHQFNCDNCLKYAQNQGAIIKKMITVWQMKNDVIRNLPPGLHLMECTGCGCLGIKLITEIAI